MTATITRSIGISPGVPWAGPLPGGGYEGKTRRLDRAVQRFAEWLRIHLTGRVEIRFNSHRLSGGAFVYPGAKGKVEFDTPEIGLGARLITPPEIALQRDNDMARRHRIHLEWEECWTEATPLVYNVLVYPTFLRNPNEMGDYAAGDRFGYWRVKTPQEAYRLLRKLTKDNLWGTPCKA
jgi:hypothetical protein